MAWFSYNCPECGRFKKSLERREKRSDCPLCNQKDCPTILKVSTIQVVERLDNGAMARSVERLHNIEEIMDERDRKNSERVMEQLGDSAEDNE